MHRSFLLALPVIFGTVLHAQITEISNLGTRLVKTMDDGLRLVRESHTGFILYDLNYNPIDTAIYPGSGDFFLSGYISNTLFDTDPSTIEYIICRYDQGYPINTSIVRTDGTVIFSKDSVTVSNSGNIEGTWFSIYNTPDGTRMELSGTPPHVYTLPGKLPCYACDGSFSEMGTGLNEYVLPTDDAPIAFPNPASDRATITCMVPPGAQHAELVLHSLTGAEVKRISLDRSGQSVVTVADLAAGTYVYQLRTDQGTVGAERLVVVH